MDAFWEKLSKIFGEPSDIFGEDEKSWANATATFGKTIGSSFDEFFSRVNAGINSSSDEQRRPQQRDPSRLPKVVSLRTKKRHSEKCDFKVGAFGENGHLLPTAYSYAHGSRNAAITRADGEKDSASLSSTGLFEYELEHAGRIFRLSKEKGHRPGKLGHIHRILEPYGWNYETSFINLTWINGKAEVQCDGQTLFRLDRHEYYEMGCESEITVDYAEEYIEDYWPVVLVALSMSGIVDTTDPDDDRIYDD